MGFKSTMRARRRRVRAEGGYRCGLEQLEDRVLLSATDAMNSADVSLWSVPQAGLDPLPAGLAAQPSGAIIQSGGTVVVTANAANGMPLLHSNPGAPVAVYLDFDGDTTTNTDAYDEDGNPSTFNASEQANITEAWRQMSIYYSMFNVDITTEYPGSTPKAWGAIGNNISGGYSYVGVVPNSKPESFNNSGDARGRVSGIAHEIGHNFGNGHQSDYDLLGNKTAEYSSGYDLLHGPLMGVDYAQVIHKWIIGHPSGGPDRLQDDMAVIANVIKRYQAGSDGYHADDYGNSIATAANLTLSGVSQTASGVIERLTDADYFRFTTTGTALDVYVAPVAPSSLDAKLEIYSFSGTLMAASDSAVNGQDIVITLPPGIYYAAVMSHGNYGDVGSYDVGVRQMADGWSATDVGVTGYGGFSQYDASTGTWTVGGSGADAWNNSDAMQLAYETLTGNGSIVARVLSVDNTDPWAKIGVTMRESLAGGSRHLSIYQTPSNGVQTGWRTSTNGGTSGYWTSGSFTPTYLRIARSGNTLTAARSTDGINWTNWGNSQTYSGLPATIYVGLAVTAHNNLKLNTATFDHVTVTGNTNVAPTYNSLPAPAGLGVFPGAGSDLVLSWAAIPGATGYLIERSEDGAVWAQAATVGTVTTWTDSGRPGSMRYFYRVSATDASGRSQPSPATSAVNRPSAVTAFAVTSLSTSALVLNWRDTSGETSYRIERSTNNVSWSQIAIVGANIPSYTDNGRSTGTTYYYRVTPLTNSGNGDVATAEGATRLAAVGNVGFDVIEYNQVTFHWTDITGEESYQIERSTDNSTWTTLTQVPADTTTYTDHAVQAFATYYYRVIGINQLTEGVYSAPLFTATPAQPPVPSPWTDTDIGAISAGAGATRYNGNGSFSMLSNGSDIWGSADACHFTYQILKGDGQITARISSQDATDDWTKVGLMVRETLAAGSKQAMVMLTPGNGVRLQYRTATNQGSTDVGGPNVSAPYWLRLVRQGNTLTALASSNGGTWTQVGQVSIAMANQVYIGLAGSSRTTDSLNATTLDNVIVTNNAPTIATPAAADPNPFSGITTTLSVLGDDDHGESNLSYTWTVLGKPAGAPNPTFSVNISNAAKTTVATFAQAGSYSLRVTVSDSSGLYTTSNVIVTALQTLTTIDVLPASVQLNPGAQQLFIARGFDQFGGLMVAQPTFNWDASAGTITPGGQFTAPASDATVTITASVGTISDTATAQVANVAPAVVSPAAASPSPVTGTTTLLSALGADDGGAAALTYTWSIAARPEGSDDPLFSDNGTNSAMNTTATFAAPGLYRFTVTIADAGGLSVDSSVDVTVTATLASIIVLPGGALVQGSGTQQFSATGYDQFGAELGAQPAFDWSATLGSIDGTGLYTGANLTGQATITAASGDISGEATVDLTEFNGPPTIVSPAASAADPVTGTTTTLSVGADDDTGEAGLTYTWEVTGKPAGVPDPVFATNGSNAAKLTEVSFARAGSYAFAVTVTDPQGLTATSTVSLTVNQTPTTLVVFPGDLSLNPGGAYTFSAGGIDQFGYPLLHSAPASWSATGGAINASTGQFTAPDSGTVTVTAVTGELSASADVSVTGAALRLPWAPRNLWATPLPGSRASLSWRDNSVDEDGFVVQVSADGSNWANYASIGASGGWGRLMSFDTGALPAGTWHFRVLAYRGNWMSSPTNVRSLELA